LKGNNPSMSSKIQIENFTSLNIKERTTLTAEVAEGATTLSLANTNNVLVDDFVLVGNPGMETAEIRQVQTVVDTNDVTIDAATLHHREGESVLSLFGDQIRIFRAPNVNGLPPAEDTFAELQTISIDPDQLQTDFEDPDGSDSYWYTFAYRNSTSAAVSSMWPASVRGGTTSVYASNDSIRDLAGFKNNHNISGGLIEQFRVAAQAKIDGKLSGRYTVPFTAPINPFIAQIARTMAAGYLQLDQYGSYTTNDTTNGDLKVKWAEAQLDAIIAGEIKLTDETGSESSASGSDLGFSGTPNSSTEDQYGNNGFMFRRTSIDGYESRQY
jgi:phage gp36-like protein